MKADVFWGVFGVEFYAYLQKIAWSQVDTFGIIMYYANIFLKHYQPYAIFMNDVALWSLLCMIILC